MVLSGPSQKIEKMYNRRKILLPQWIWDSASNDEFKKNLSIYIKRSYPDVRVVGIEKPFAICER